MTDCNEYRSDLAEKIKEIKGRYESVMVLE